MSAGTARRPADGRPQRVYLVGFMGAGKTSVGRLLAERLAAGFVDLDREVERAAGATVREIFDRGGEAEFRRLERRALERTLGLERVVVATGGGTVASAENRELIGRAGVSVWLKPGLADLLERLEPLAASEPGERPLLGDRRQAEALYRDRLVAYGEASLAIEIAPGETSAGVAERVARILAEAPCAF